VGRSLRGSRVTSRVCVCSARSLLLGPPHSYGQVPGSSLLTQAARSCKRCEGDGRG